jgi:hypothetical protein
MCLFSQDPAVKRFLDTRNSLGPWARENVCGEASALASGIDVEHLLGAAVLALREEGKFFATIHYPEMMRKRFEYAMLQSGWRDRNFINQLVGLFPIDDRWRMTAFI